MANEENAVKIYARVQGDKIIEYPVSAQTIAQRGHSLRQYYPVYVDDIDVTGEAGVTFDTVLKVEGMSVHVTHVKRNMSLSETIERFRLSNENGVWKPYEYSDIPVAEMRYFEKVLAAHFEDQLEAVVKKRYTSLDTLLGRYRNSSNPVWKKEADFIQGKLDALWSTLVQYFAELQQGKRPLPVAMKDVGSLVIPTSWDDMQ